VFGCFLAELKDLQNPANWESMDSLPIFGFRFYKNLFRFDVLNTIFILTITIEQLKPFSFKVGNLRFFVDTAHIYFGFLKKISLNDRGLHFQCTNRFQYLHLNSFNFFLKVISDI